MWSKDPGGGHAPYPKVKRVCIASDLKDWKAGTFQKRSGRELHGVQIKYEQSRARYHREGYKARRLSGLSKKCFKAVSTLP
jgi:hypothetical protein